MAFTNTQITTILSASAQTAVRNMKADWRFMDQLIKTTANKKALVVGIGDATSTYATLGSVGANGSVTCIAQEVRTDALGNTLSNTYGDGRVDNLEETQTVIETNCDLVRANGSDQVTFVTGNPNKQEVYTQIGSQPYEFVCFDISNPTNLSDVINTYLNPYVSSDVIVAIKIRTAYQKVPAMVAIWELLATAGSIWRSTAVIGDYIILTKNEPKSRAVREALKSYCILNDITFRFFLLNNYQTFIPTLGLKPDFRESHRMQPNQRDNGATYVYSPPKDIINDSGFDTQVAQEVAAYASTL